MQKVVIFSLFFLGSLLVKAQQISVFPSTDTRLLFAQSEIKKAKPKIKIFLIADSLRVLAVCNANNFEKPKYNIRESFAIRSKGSTYYVLSNDAAGAMYGGLELADYIKFRKLNEYKTKDVKPYLNQRGIKFNVPLDLRTPSYTDPSDAAQANISEVWKLDFWEEYFDEMARNRMNIMSLWSLNAFPSMVHVPSFPDVSLDDVWRTKGKYSDETFSMTGRDWEKLFLFKDVEIVKKITIQEKMVFWRKVMQMAENRGISVYLFHWNMFTYSMDGKHGITHDQSNEKTIAYFRAATAEMIKQYPLLKGIGITAGEWMEKDRKDEYSNEKWLWKTYGQGINDGLKLTPKRDFRLIHRFHMTGLKDIQENFKDLNCRLDLSLKYAVAHMYSIPNPPFVKEAFPLLSEKYKTWMTIRNDDIYSMRWANYDFAKAFIDNIPYVNLVAGYYMGPDGYSWGRDYLSKGNMNQKPDLVIKKQWVSNRMWGLLSYDPTLPKSFFDNLIKASFGKENTENLMPAWESASMIFPYITRFVWGDIDLKWFPEANISSKEYRGFYTVEEYINRMPMEGSNISGIAQWFHSDATASGLVSPMMVVDSLEILANQAFAGLKKMPPYSHLSKNELQQTQSDIEAFGEIGMYYSLKIKAAFALAEYDKNGNQKLKSDCLVYLKTAEGHWNKYAEIYTQKNKTALYNRLGIVDMNALKEEVKKDYDIVNNWQIGKIKYEAKNIGNNVFKK